MDVQHLEREAQIAGAAAGGDDVARRDAEAARRALRPGQADAQARAGDAGQRQALELRPRCRR